MTDKPWIRTAEIRWERQGRGRPLKLRQKWCREFGGDQAWRYLSLEYEWRDVPVADTTEQDRPSVPQL